MLSGPTPPGVFEMSFECFVRVGMTPSDCEIDTYSDVEAKARAEPALKRMLATQHKPHDKLKNGEGASEAERSGLRHDFLQWAAR